MGFKKREVEFVFVSSQTCEGFSNVVNYSDQQGGVTEFP